MTDGLNYKKYERELILGMNKKKIIVYGLGKAYENQKYFVEKEFEIIGYSDKVSKDIPLYVAPEDINTREYDYIYVTSNKFFDEIKQYLLSIFGGAREQNHIFESGIRRL